MLFIRRHAHISSRSHSLRQSSSSSSSSSSVSPSLVGITVDVTGTLFRFRRSIGEEYAAALFHVAPTACAQNFHDGQLDAAATLQESVGLSLRHVSVHAPQPFGGSLLSSRAYWRMVVDKSVRDAGIELTERERTEVFNRIYDDVYGTGGEDTYAVYPDALVFLRRARARGLIVGAVTNSDERYRTQVLPSLGLSEHLDFVVTSKEALFEKPDARIFKLAMASSVSAAPPGAWAHVGDNEKRDYRGARAAGMRAVLLNRREDGSVKSFSDDVDANDVATNLVEALDLLLPSSSPPL